MTLEELKNRTISILRAVDAVHFHNAIQEIAHIQKVGGTGFDDVYVKAYVMRTAINAMAENNYFIDLKNKRNITLLNILYEDGDLSEESKQKLLDNDMKEEDIPELNSLFKDAFEKYRKIINLFFANADQLRQHYQQQSKNSRFIQIEESADLFKNLGRDIGQDEEETVILKKNTSIGTTGLGSCLAICITGKTKNHKTVTSIQHLSTTVAEDIEEVKLNLCNKLGMRNQSIQIYLVGGCIGTLGHNLEILMNLKLGITDFRLCTTVGEKLEDTARILMTGTNPGAVYYAISNQQPPCFSATKQISPASGQEKTLKRSRIDSEQPPALYESSTKTHRYDTGLYVKNDEPFLNYFNRKEENEKELQNASETESHFSRSYRR